MVVSMNAFVEMRRLRLSGREREVLDYLMLNVEFGNVAVGISYKSMAGDLKSSVQVMRRTVARLENVNLIERKCVGVIYLNPNFWFKGTPEDQRSAVFKWHKLRMEKIGAA